MIYSVQFLVQVSRCRDVSVILTTIDILKGKEMRTNQSAYLSSVQGRYWFSCPGFLWLLARTRLRKHNVSGFQSIKKLTITWKLTLKLPSQYLYPVLITLTTFIFSNQENRLLFILLKVTQNLFDPCVTRYIEKGVFSIRDAFLSVLETKIICFKNLKGAL